jgi:hypothetical protein
LTSKIFIQFFHRVSHVLAKWIHFIVVICTIHFTLIY